MLQSSNVVEMTLFDTLHGLYEIAQEKAQLAGVTVESFVKQHGAITKIADEFSGGSRYSKQTTRTLAGVTVRIKPLALNRIGQIMTEEDPLLARRVLERNMSQSTLRDEEIFDARAYKNLISSNTIRGATAFLNANAEDQEKALLKLKFGYEMNGFKCFQASHLNKETKRIGRARHQIHLMKLLMGRDKWPEELADVENKLFTSSHFDNELDEHDEESILPSLITEYRHRMPLEAGLRWRLYCAERENRNSSQNGQQYDSNTTATGSGQGIQQEGTDNPEIGAEGSPGHQASVAQLCPLERLKVNCENLTLERYSIFRKTDDEKFHLITGDPTQLQLNGSCNVYVDPQQADKCIGILKLLLHPHGWVFFYTRAADYAMWDKAFHANGFELLGYPWLMIRDTDAIQTNTSPIPQNVAELLIGARKRDVGRPEFQPLIDSTYKRAVSSRKRKFAIMDCCPEPRLKVRKANTRELLRPNQRSPEPMGEFLDTFCPPDGNVLDAFAGTMETGRACYLTGRSCVILEADKYCFDRALEHLKESASGYLDERDSTSEPSDVELQTCANFNENPSDTSTFSESD